MKPVIASPFRAEREAADWRKYDASSSDPADHDLRDEGVRMALIYRGRGRAKEQAAALQRLLDGDEFKARRQQSALIANRAPAGSGLTTDRKSKAAKAGSHRSWSLRPRKAR